MNNERNFPTNVRFFIDKILGHLSERRFTSIEKFVNVIINGQEIPFLLTSEFLGVCAFFFIDLENNTPLKVEEIKDKFLLNLDFGSWSCDKKNPFVEVVTLKDSLHVPDTNQSPLFHPASFVLLHRGLHCFVVCLNSNRLAVEKISKVKPKDLKVVVGTESQVNEEFETFLKFSLQRRQPLLQAKLAYGRVRNWLQGIGEKSYFDNIQLTEKQKKFSFQSTTKGCRRIKGVAGSGKSLVLALRATTILSSGASVLILCFNKTTVRYLEYLISNALAWLNKNKPLAEFNIRINHFHGFIKTIVPYDNKKAKDDKQLYFDETWPNEVLSVIKETGPFYDAVLIDEGQDWPLSWLKVAKACSRNKEKEGELYLFSDSTQNIYSRETVSDKDFFALGFKGSWAELDGSFRMPSAFLGPINRFIKNFIPESDELYCEEQWLDPLHIRWIQIEDDIEENVYDLAAQEITDVLFLKNIPTSKKNEFEPMSPGDIVFLTEIHGTGKAISKRLLLNNKEIHTIFEGQDKESFDNSLNLIKGSTIASYKGLENRAIILVLEKENPLLKKETKKTIESLNMARDREIYVALGRLKSNLKGACITVICQDPRYAEYGATWAKEGDFIDYRRKRNCSQFQEDFIFNIRESRDNSGHKILPDWLPNLIEAMGGRKFETNSLLLGRENSLNVYENLYNTPEQNQEYLNRYFPRSICESYSIFKDLFSNPAIHRHFSSLQEIRILSYGTGTGGDLLGVFLALTDAHIVNKPIKINIIEGNSDAIRKTEQMLSFIKARIPQELWYFVQNYSVKVDEVEGAMFDIPTAEEEYEIIQTSKMLNEIVRIGDQKAYYNFEDQVLKKLSPKGLAVILDVPIVVSSRISRNNYFPSEWTSILLNKQTENFIYKNPGFSVVFPLPCQDCIVNRENKRVRKSCYTAKIYSYKLSEKDSNLYKTTVTMRVLVRSSFYNEIKSTLHLDGGKRYATAYRLKDNGINSCPSFLESSQCFDAYSFKEIPIKKERESR